MGCPTKWMILFIRDQEEGSGFQLYLGSGNLPVPFVKGLLYEHGFQHLSKSLSVGFVI